MSRHLIPLAERMRPLSLDDYMGQEHLVGSKGLIRRMIASGNLASLIFWGPPGTGKTTLAQLLAQILKRPFYTLSAISAGVKDVREVIDKAKYQPGTVLFIDEIHRFSKSQQDALLGAVEKGSITLIGATTENPSFEVNAALLSRCQVYVLESLPEDALRQLIDKAIAVEQETKQVSIVLQEVEALLALSGGDARKMLNLLEMTIDAASENPVLISNEAVSRVAQQRSLRYDKNGEQHYDIVSAFIKSIRGSDPNAAVYWLVRMVEAGEDPLFIARRMVIAASEDIGNANPTALVIAVNCFQAVSYIGYPEAAIVLSHAATYLASSAKSNASYMALRKAQEIVKQQGDLPVPLHLRNAPTALMKKLGYGQQYQYAHDFLGNFADQEYMPDDLSGHRFYEPGKNAREEELRTRLRKLWGDKYSY